MRIGKNELKILYRLDQRERYGVGQYNEMRKDVGLGDEKSPETIRRMAEKRVKEEWHRTSFSRAKQIYTKHYLGGNRVLFSQAINRLIKKGLVVREWEVYHNIDIDPEELFTGIAHFGGETYITDDNGNQKLIYKDVRRPPAHFSKTKTYKITHKGREVLEKIYIRRRIEKMGLLRKRVRFQIALRQVTREMSKK